MEYEPRLHGARCDECILRTARTGDPVPPESYPDAAIAVVAEAPGEEEVRYGRPLIGPSGREEMAALAGLGLRREQIHWTNALLCQPPGNNLDAVLASLRGKNQAIRRRNEPIQAENKRLQAENRRRARAGIPPDPLLPLIPELPHPIEACRARLLDELAGKSQVIALGKIALQALDPQHTAGILKCRGNPLALNWEQDPDGAPRLSRVQAPAVGHQPLNRHEFVPASPPRQVVGDIRVLPTLHPAFVLRAGRWREPFREDHRRAVRHFRSALTWRNPEMLFNPEIAALAELLGVVRRPEPPEGCQRWPVGKPTCNEEAWKIPVSDGWSRGWWADPARTSLLAYDWETDALESIECIARCIQIGTRERVLAPFFASVEGADSRYSPDELDSLRGVLAAWLSGSGWKVGHNVGAYDQVVNAAFLGVLARFEADQILGHRLIEGELPHNLAYVGSRYEDVHDWKAGDPGVHARSDRELGVYGCLDSAVTYSTASKIFPEVARRGLGGFAAPGLETRLLSEPQTVAAEQDAKGKLTFEATAAKGGRGSNWWWVHLDPQIPYGLPLATLVVHDPQAPNQTDPDHQPGLVAFSCGLATPQTEVQVRALAEAGAPVVREGLVGLLALDHSIQAGARGMHIIGMQVDQPTRLKFLAEQSERFEAKRAVLREVVEQHSDIADWGKGRPFNPASIFHLRKLLYEGGWDLPVTVESEKTRAPSTGDTAVRQLLALQSLPDHARMFLLALRDFRKAHKILGTYLRPTGLRPSDEKARPIQGWGRAWDTDVVLEDDAALDAYGEVDWDDEEQADLLAAVEGADSTLAEDAFHARYWYAEPGKSKLRVNGRLHASWLSHASVTGRLSSSPNLLNVIRWLRSMFVPASLAWLEFDVQRMRSSPNEIRLWSAYGVDLHKFKPREGHCFVYADSDQLELRIAASRWKVAKYLEAFATSKIIGGRREWMDPHQITMHAIWGDKIWSMPGAPVPSERYYKRYGKNSEFDRARDLGKRALYASQYGALAPTVHDIITSAEDRKGNLLYPELTLAHVRVMQRNLLRNMPEFKAGWAWELDTLKNFGHLTEPVVGRQFDCLDGFDDLSLVVNRCIQAGGAGIVALATAEMLEKYPVGFGGPYTGLANHCHDAMTWEVPISLAEQVASDLTEAMTRIIPAYPDVRFMGNAEIITVWQ